MAGKKIDKSALQIQVMEIDKAVAQGDRESATDGTHPYLQKTALNSNMTNSPVTQEPNTIIITRDPKNIAPNMTLNCTADGDRWQVRACAVIGIIIQTGVLVFFGFLTEHSKLKFDKDGSPVESYAMPMAVIGTLAVNFGILICAYVVDESSTEETYEILNKDTAAVATVWLQKEKNVSDQHFDSAAIYPTMTRHQACISKRRDEKQDLQLSITRRMIPYNTRWLEAMATIGALVSVLGFFIQFIGLRGMHWLASIAQLAAVIIMTILRAIIRRHLASGLKGHDLKILTGFELEWFITSLLEDDGAPWIPKDSPLRKNGNSLSGDHTHGDNPVETGSSKFEWIVQTGDPGGLEKSSPASEEATEPLNRTFGKVSDLSAPQSILDLRRHFGELSGWHGPASKEALAVAQAIEKTMNFFMQYAEFDMEEEAPEDESEPGFTLDDDVSLSTIDLSDDSDDDPDDCSNHDPAIITEDKGADQNVPSDTVERPKSLDWTFNVGYSYGQLGGGQGDTVTVKLKRSESNGWSVPVDVIDASLSLWLFSTKEHHIPDTPEKRFPCGGDQWIRGDLIQEEKSLQILGPPTELLLRDLYWWMPDALNGILDARIRQSMDSPQEFPQQVKKYRIVATGERWYTSAANIYTRSPLSRVPISDDSVEGVTHWRWQPAEKHVERPVRRADDDLPAGESSEPEEHTQNPFRRLVVQTEDPLYVLQAKGLFSCFLWSMASSLGRSSVSRRLQASITALGGKRTSPWKSYSLQNYQLSQLVQSIARLGLWTEWEVWASLIPPLSATDNLPGLEALIQTVITAGAQQERAREWDRSIAAYRWLFDIGNLSLPDSHIRVKSSAILWRFCERLPSRYSQELQAILKEEKQHHQELYTKLENFFNLHQRLEHFKHRPRQVISGLYEAMYGWAHSPVGNSTIHKDFQKQGDIFDRTYLHHIMLSRFIDDHVYTLLNKGWRLRYERRHQLYEKCIAKAVKVVKELKLYPMRLLEHLFWTIFFSDTTLELVLKDGADPNARDLDHLTPLHYVCRAAREDKLLPGHHTKRQCEIADKRRIRALLENRADINAQDLKGNSPLHSAISSGREDLVQVLISYRCNFNISNIEGQTPLHLASTLENGKCVVLLLEAGAEVDVQDQARQTPLHIAVAAKNTQCIEMLMERGAKQDILGKEYRTPLMLAVSLDYLPAVELLYNGDHLTEVTFNAVHKGAVEVVGWCMGKTDISSWPPRNGSGTPFHCASFHDQPEVMAKLLRKGEELKFGPEIVFELNDRGDTALCHAAILGHLRVVEVLKENLAPGFWNELLEQAGPSGMTPLLASMKISRPMMSSYLVNHGANVRARTGNGRNLLHLAAWWNLDLMHKAIEMINSGKWSSHLNSMLEERDEEGRTPRDVAESEGNSGVVKLLDEELKRLRGVGYQAGDDRSNGVKSRD
jgi:ankyrin repeat protein